MTTPEIAHRLVHLCRTGDYQTAHDELLSPDIVSIEPENMPGPVRERHGIDEVNKALQEFATMHKEVLEHRCSDPVIAGNVFAVSMGLKTVQHDDSMMDVDEIAVYTVKDGKILKQEFFYSM